MRESGVLKCAKVGKEMHYWPDPKTVRDALDAVRIYLNAEFPETRS